MSLVQMTQVAYYYLKHHLISLPLYDPGFLFQQRTGFHFWPTTPQTSAWDFCGRRRMSDFPVKSNYIDPHLRS